MTSRAGSTTSSAWTSSPGTGREPPGRQEAFTTTLFRFAQYFGWTEILHRDVQFLSFPTREETREVASLQLRIARCLLSDERSHAMMIWSDQQRAIGEQMIVKEHGKVLCMGYARFTGCCDDVFGAWKERIRVEILSPEARPRLRELQHLLCQLVHRLDPDAVRYERLELVA